MAERRELTQEEYEALSPSDRAHYDIKGRLDDGLVTEDSDATKTARAAAFKLDNAQGKPIGDTDVEARAEELESAKRDAEVSDPDSEENGDVTTEGVAGEEAAGVGTGEGPQSPEEASATEEARREEMSGAEKAEAEARDRVAAGLEPDDRDSGSVPNVGSPDEAGRENANDETEAGQSFGTGPDERTQP